MSGNRPVESKPVSIFIPEVAMRFVLMLRVSWLLVGCRCSGIVDYFRVTVLWVEFICSVVTVSFVPEWA